VGANVTGKMIEESRNVTWLDGDYDNIAAFDGFDRIRGNRSP
jgi:hypothetical protein